MSIQSEITRISGNVSDALDAIERKGVAVPSTANSDDLAGLIDQIPSGIVINDSLNDSGGIIRSITATNMINDHVILNPTVTGVAGSTVTASGRRCGDVVSITIAVTPDETISSFSRIGEATIGNIPYPHVTQYAVSAYSSNLIYASFGTSGNFIATTQASTYTGGSTRYFTFTYIYRGDE